MTGLSVTIGPRVAAARNRRRKSIDDLASISGLSAIDLQLIEFGQVRPSPRQLRLLASALDVEWLCFLPPSSMPDESESVPSIGDLRKRVSKLVSETDDEELLQGILALLRAEKVRSVPQDEGISAPMMDWTGSFFNSVSYVTTCELYVQHEVAFRRALLRVRWSCEIGQIERRSDSKDAAT